MKSLNQHQPVLLDSVLQYLQPVRGASYLDLTAGYGAHAAAVIGQTSNPAQATLVDRDQAAVKQLGERFKTATIINSDYATAATQLVERGQQFELILLDLGLSSLQLDDPARGFSFKKTGPLDMRMDTSQSLTAAEIVNHYSEPDLADLIYQYGEERRSRQIARAIVSKRPLHSTTELAEVIRRCFRSYSRIHPATRTFQALRIAVNDELGQLSQTLPLLPALLKDQGRLVIISFHSLEDRLVKQFLKGEQTLERLNTKAVMGSKLDTSNPRARSARLRAAIKKNKKEAQNGYKTKSTRQ